MTQYFNQSDHKRQRQAARANMPKAEAMLWSVLKGRKMLGCKFRRQFGVGAYRLDFYRGCGRAAGTQIEAQRNASAEIGSDPPCPPFLRGGDNTTIAPTLMLLLCATPSLKSDREKNVPSI